MSGPLVCPGSQARRAGDEVEVRLAVELRTPLYSEVRAVGSLGELGGWQPAAGLPLQTDPALYPKWCTSARWPKDAFANGPIEFKFVIVSPDGTATWEEGPNRLLHIEDKESFTGGPDCHASEEQRAAATSTRGRQHRLSWEAVCTGTGLGDVLAVVGGAEVLGNWDPTRALRLETSAERFPKWEGAALLDAEAVRTTSWKLVVLKADGSCEWEPVENRCITLPSGSSAQAWLLRAAFGGECEAPVPQPRPTCKALPGLSRQSLVFYADADAHIEVVFENSGLRCSPEYDPRAEAWVLALAEAGLEPGMHTFHALVDGDRVLSDFHPVANSSPEQSIVLFNDELWSYATGMQAHMQQPHNQIQTQRFHDDAKCTRPKSSGLSPRKAGFVRPASTSSTASTCSTNSDEDEQDLSPKPFSPAVFAGLYDGDLQVRLGSHVPPTSFLHGQSQELKLWAGAHRLHKPCGRCEDAFFIGSSALGVADGVGSMVQFAKYGTDAAAYAEELMELAAAAVRPGGAADGARWSGQSVQDRAEAALTFAETRATTYGASTASVLLLEGTSMGVANLGDSGFMVLRRGPEGMAIAAQSEEQQHYWNCPFQLCRLPPALQRRVEKGVRFDSASSCDRYQVTVQPGDLLLMFTDGLSDNLHEHELLQIVNRALAPVFGELAGSPELATPPAVVAEALARAAQERSLDTKAMVPFSEASKKQGMNVPGGKPDDITVVAAWVVPEAPQLRSA